MHVHPQMAAPCMAVGPGGIPRLSGLIVSNTFSEIDRLRRVFDAAESMSLEPAACAAQGGSRFVAIRILAMLHSSSTAEYHRPGRAIAPWCQRSHAVDTAVISSARMGHQLT